MFARVSVCPPAETSTNLNKDLVNADNVTLDKAVRENLAKLAAEWVEDNEAADIFEELKSLKVENHWRNWYLGYTEAKLPYTEYGARYYKIHTTVVPGYISSPLFGQTFTEETFHQKMVTDLYIYLHGNITGNLSMVMMVEMDTKGSFGGSDVLQRYMPEYKIYRYTEHINESWYLPIAEIYRVYYNRDIDSVSIADWSTKRITGFTARWYVQNTTGHRVGIQQWDKFREPTKNQNVNKDKLIINNNNTNIMANLLGLGIKNMTKTKTKTPYNEYFVRMVNIVDNVINNRHINVEQLWEDVKNFRFGLLGQDALQCYTGMLKSHDMETFLEEEERRLNMTRGIGPVHKDNISDSTLNTAAKMFVYIANCNPTSPIKPAWNKFYADLLTNSSPRLIVQTLTSLTKLQTKGLGKINIPAELITRLGKYFSFQFDKIKIALASSRKVAKKQPKLVGMDFPDCFYDKKCGNINEITKTVGIRFS